MSTAVLNDTQPAMESRRVCGWGGGEPVPVHAFVARRADQLAQFLVSGAWSGPGAIARGLGRSYGDAAQITAGTVLETSALKGRTLDPEAGVVTVAAGETIGELIAALVPVGWMLPVVPGTQHVTIGGAIASDIHGKNHGRAGTLGAHVQTLGLLTATGETLELERGRDDVLLAATAGGMGLTGVIIWARIALEPVGSGLMSVDTDRGSDLDRLLALLSEPGGSYRVAWLDLLAPRQVRGVVTRAEHRAGGGSQAVAVSARATVPNGWPAGLLRAGTVRAFNDLRYRRAPQRERARVEPLGRHLFPLDVLDAWPRLYGRHGFVQYQCVVPVGSEAALEQMIERVRRSRVPCFLAVLKDFGPAAGGPLSFPLHGWTLALDLPRAAPDLAALLDALDELVAGAGGRVYLTKDSRLSPARLEEMYPRLAEWRAVRDRLDPDGIWRSDLAVRTGLVAGR
jgi:decaprenylphospho-beta-D-ribofuranose 2-oxidase